MKVGTFCQSRPPRSNRSVVGILQNLYTKLLRFIDSNQHYGTDRLYGLLSSTGELPLSSTSSLDRNRIDLFEARAILLGRLGRHDQALELYVFRMHDYLKAEE